MATTLARGRLRQVFSAPKVGKCVNHFRVMSSLVNVEKQGDFAVLELNREPVNSFTLEFLQEINAELDKVNSDKDCKGLIITSSLPKVFSAGLDLVKEVFKPADERRLASFWQEFQGMWLRLYGSRLITMAAINGHALAGGCVLGLACDYRIMADGPRIGLVETEAGVPPPFWVFHNLAAVVGNGVAEKALLSSKRYTAQEALAVGLVDKVVPKDEVLAATKSQMEELTAFSARTLELTKKIMRKDAVETLENKREEDIKEFVDCVTDEEVQRAIGMQIERITKKK
ncbi:enoyl-CoA delta isomerase 1, mitochondrial-like [Acropora millepora]|uniref:enoyl-CoA delta isomerase 1, mitochondrial-like n=1 Tax=Acropora millepora TaxID=45264 RepID=UPI001CF25671|nr:enoyl-CoA delta isomerase 1, mitochondrial-like [Acropora millepora]